MTTDDLVDRLRADWRRDAANPAVIARAFARHRRSARARLATAGAGALVVLAGLAWLAGLAVTRRDLMIATAAAAFAAAMPVIGGGLLVLWRQARQAYDATPESLLVQTQDRLTTDQRLLRGARWCACILILATLGLWLVVAAGQAPAASALSPTGFWIVTPRWSGYGRPGGRGG